MPDSVYPLPATRSSHSFAKSSFFWAFSVLAVLVTVGSTGTDPAHAQGQPKGQPEGQAGDPTPYEAAFRDGEVLLPRHPAPSPDGSRIAFCYQGDLWTVPATGGEARRLTAHPALESYPLWSPDGSWIAFCSNRNGNDDVFAIPLAGGPVRQLTFDSDSEYVSDWTADGKAILVHSRRHVLDGRNSGLWWVPVDGGMPGWVQPIGGSMGVLSPDGTRLAFTRTSTSWWRRGYEGEGRSRLYLHELGSPLVGATPLPELAQAGARSASDTSGPAGARSTSDAGEPNRIGAGGAHTLGGWLAGAAIYPGGSYVELTSLAAERGTPRSQPDRSRTPDFARPDQEFGGNGNPFWFPDGEHLLYRSEIHGVTNLKVMEVSTGSRAWVTRFEDGDGRLRHPSLSRDGSLAVFEYEDGIYAVDIPSQLPAPGTADWPAPPGEPRRVSIRLPLDERIPARVQVSVTGGADELALSPDDEQIVFVKDGDIFAMKASEDEPWAYPLATDPARDQEVVWSPDSKSIVFVSDRAGHHDLYVLRSADPEEPRLARTLELETTRLTDTPEDDHEPAYSPGGDRIAFRRGNGTLVTIRPDGSDETVLVEGWSDLSFSWSPDGKWLAYVQQDSDFNREIYLIPADGSAPPYNLTRHPDNEWGPSWSADGRILAFVSSRRFPNERDIWYVRLSREDDELAKEDRLDRKDSGKKKGKGGKDEKSEGKKASDDGDDDENDNDNGDEDGDAKKDLPEVRIDFEGLAERVHRLTSLPGRESQVWVTPDGEEFIFSTDTDGKRDLWKVRWDGEEETRLTKGGTNPRAVQLDSKGKRIYYLKSGAIQSIAIGGGDSKSYRYEAEIEVDRFARRLAVFDEAWREIGAKFYDPAMHGADWNRIRGTYGGWAGAASTYRDFHDVLKMMLGEVGASHMNVWGGPGDGSGERWSPDEREEGVGALPEGPWDDVPWDDVPLEVGPRESGRLADGWTSGPGGDAENGLDSNTAELGVFFDPAFAGPGLRVLRVVPEGPADRVESRIEPGETLLSVDGVRVGPGVSLATVLDRRDGRRVRVEVRGTDGKTRDVVVRPIRRRDLRSLLYETQVDLRQAEVERTGEGRLAYVHIKSMDVSSLEEFERSLYAQAHGKDALIVDVRDNGGGWITDLMLTSINASDHAQTIPRGGGRGYPQDRRLMYAWTKPVVVLCNEYSFSNAEIFSWSIQTTERGPVVGQHTYGGVISTGGMNLGDGTWLRLPFRGWYSLKDGTNMEAEGCRPDVIVENDLGTLGSGQDLQLEEAVRLALAELR